MVNRLDNHASIWAVDRRGARCGSRGAPAYEVMLATLDRQSLADPLVRLAST